MDKGGKGVPRPHTGHSKERVERSKRVGKEGIRNGKGGITG